MTSPASPVISVISKSIPTRLVSHHENRKERLSADSEKESSNLNYLIENHYDDFIYPCLYFK